MPVQMSPVSLEMFDTRYNTKEVHQLHTLFTASKSWRKEKNCEEIPE